VDALEQVVLSNAVVATALALLASAVGLVCRRPALVHSLWLLVLIKLITPPIWQVELFRLPPAKSPESLTQAFVLPVRSENQIDIAEVDKCLHEDDEEMDAAEKPILVREDTASPASQNLTPSLSFLTENIWKWSSLRPLLWSVWLAGTVGCLLVAVIRVIRFQLLLRWAEPAPSDLQERVQLLAECLGLASVPRVWLVPGAVSPMIWPIGLRPRLLVPFGLLDRLTPEQRDTLLAHELAHLLRRDHWVRGLELIVTGLYWWHPVVWWGRQAIREAEEESCDAWVLWLLPASSRAYASALVEALDFLAGARPALLPPAACGLGQFQTLKRRLTMILTGTTPRALSRLGFLAVLGLGILLPVLPTWGRAAGDDDDQKIEKKFDKEDFIKKLKEDTLKNIDLKGIKKQVQDALDKELNMDVDLGGLGDLKVDLNLDLEGIFQNLEQLDETLKDGGGRKDLDRARAEIKRALAQVERAKAQFERAQAVLKKAQAKLADMEAGVKTNPDKADMKDSWKKGKLSQDLADQIKKSMDKADWKGLDKAQKEKAEKALKDFTKKKGADSRSKDDDLEKRLDKLMREVQDLSRDLKRRRAADKNEDGE
jgi:beta-lactamase regulating signal transducer with metallopeptidase domain